MTKNISPLLQDQFLANDTAYSNSIAIKKIKKRITHREMVRIAFLDIDSTMTVSGSSIADPQSAERVREKLEQEGFVIFAITSRVEEMLMSRASYEKTVARGDLALADGAKRLPPHLKRNGDGTFSEQYPDDNSAFTALYDFDGMFTQTGAVGYVRQEDGSYAKDREYELHIKNESGHWRDKTRAILETVLPKTLVEKDMAPIDAFDDTSGEKNGSVDIATPTDARMQCMFETLEEKQQFENAVKLSEENKEMSEDIKEKLHDIRVTDDSNPEKGVYSIFVTPRYGWKTHAVEHVISQICDDTAIARKYIEIIYAGDSYPDLTAGLYGGLGTKATFILAKNSRLEDFFLNKENNEFAGIKLQAIKKRLVVNSRRGEGAYFIPLHGKREVIIAGRMFPNARNSVDSVYIALQHLYPDRNVQKNTQQQSVFYAPSL
jgi:hypothetical protein